MDALEETAEFLQIIGEFFSNAHSVRIKHAYSEVFVELLEPIAAVRFTPLSFCFDPGFLSHHPSSFNLGCLSRSQPSCLDESCGFNPCQGIQNAWKASPSQRKVAKSPFRALSLLLTQTHTLSISFIFPLPPFLSLSYIYLSPIHLLLLESLFPMIRLPWLSIAHF